MHHAAVHQAGAGAYEPSTLDEWSPPVTPERIAAYLDWMQSGTEAKLVAVVGDRIVGFASIVAESEELRSVYVSPDFGRRGVGSQLLREVEALGLKLGLHHLRLDSSLNAEAFYEAHGYESDERGTHTLRSGATMACVRMHKVLRPG